MLKAEVLKGFTPFNSLSEGYLEEALRHIYVSQFMRGQMVFKRGKIIGDRYFLLDGNVDLIDNTYRINSVEDTSDEASSALNIDAPTKCSCVVKSSYAKIFTIESKVLDRIIAWSEASSKPEPAVDAHEFKVEELDQEEVSDWMSSLLRLPLFTKISLTQVQELFTRFESVEAKSGDVIVQEGEEGDYFYVLASGEAEVNNRTNSVNVVLKPGQYFGEDALVGNTVRNASVTMTESGVLKRLNSEDFSALLKSPVLKYVEDDELKNIEAPYQLIDVKIPLEFRAQHHPDSINIPLSRLREMLKEFNSTDTYVVTDDAGSRADIAAHILCQAGFNALILKSAAA